MATIDVSLFREQEAQKFITCRRHPTEDLLIWNYTDKCRVERIWNDITTQARGLITRPDGTIVARPFKKFFNFEYTQGVFPNEPFTVTMKWDGSLGVLFQVNGEPQIATRGSFVSSQAIKANEILNQYKNFPFEPTYTYLFEIVYPENRIVVNYGDREDIVLLAIIETETGNEINIHNQTWPFPVVKKYDGIEDFDDLKALNLHNEEGYVIRFKNGLRYKIKFEDYKRLHYIMTTCTARVIWEHLKNNKPLSQILDRVPVEFEKWVRDISRDLGQSYERIHKKVMDTYKEVTQQTAIETPIVVGKMITPKEVEIISRAMKKHIKSRFAKYPDIETFLLFWYSASENKKERLHDEIWKSLYPPHSRPFTCGEEEA